MVVSNWIDPKQAVLLSSMHSLRNKASPPRSSPVVSARKLRLNTESKRADSSLKRLVLSNLREGQASNSGKANLRQFPKRQSQLKNDNAYKYFEQSSKKICTEQEE